MLLFEELKSCGFEYLLTRRLNQGSLENFFGKIRQQGGNAINPTPIQFSRAFKKLVGLNFFKYSENTNCEEDNLDSLKLFSEWSKIKNPKCNLFSTTQTKFKTLQFSTDQIRNVNDYRQHNFPQENAQDIF